MGVSHKVVEKGVYCGREDRFWESRTYKFVGGRGDIFWEGGVDSCSITFSCWKRGYILRVRGRFWERRLILSGRDGWIFNLGSENTSPNHGVDLTG